MVGWTVAVTDENAVGDGSGDIRFCGGNRFLHAFALGKLSSDASGIGAAGTMGTFGIHTFGAEAYHFAILGDEDVFRIGVF